nr:MAG TPA_asm: hypothetical protein [Caudoviricetes sp.]
MEVFAVSLRSPAKVTERRGLSSARGAFLWASGGIRTREATQLLVQHEKFQPYLLVLHEKIKVDFQACPKNLPPKDRRPRPIKTKSALHLEIISPVPKSEPPSTKCRVAPAGRALSLSRVPHAKKAT